MVRTKFFTGYHYHTKAFLSLEAEINDFLEVCGDSIEVVDVKLSSFYDGDSSVYTALLIYRDLEHED